jgi:hypothetical protein
VDRGEIAARCLGYVPQRTDGRGRFAYNPMASPASAGPHRKSKPMNLQITLAPILALLAGILILVRPKLLNFIVAIYLIVIGILGLTGNRF